ncbi:MAG: glycosyltransferase [Marinilabiliaceae bacterium]|nr:glycosyltransferase [Marinilabiliaceae bacterium]
MRIGTNPEKNRESKLIHKPHRIIMPFWIPNVEDDYFKNQPEVLRLCLQSLTESIDIERTNITLINNNSCREASLIAEEFVNKGLIDKYVVRSENRGKLENILAEARASYEDYITISDADFLFLKGWEKAVSDIMMNFPKAGMVSCYPAAHLAYFYNSNIILLRLKSKKIISDEEINLFENGHGHSVDTGLYSRKGLQKRYSWRERHYYIKKNNVIAILGAVHALATFRKEVVQGFNANSVDFVFKNGYEHEFIDFSTEKNGYIRLSTPKLFAYHLGNTIPKDILSIFENKNKEYEMQSQNYKLWQSKKLKKFTKIYSFFFPIVNILFRVLRKFKII